MSEPVGVAAPITPPPLPAPPPATPWKGLALDVLLAVVGIFIVSTMLVTPIIILEAFKLPDHAKGADPEQLMQAALPAVTVAAIASMAIVGLLAWWLRGRTQAPVQPRLPLGTSSLLAVAGGLVVQAGALGVFHALQWLAPQGPGQPSNAEPILALQQAAPALNWLMVVLVAPLGEELLFRRVMLHRFMLAGRGVAGLIVTSLLFAATHELGLDGGNSLAQWLGLVTLYTGMGMGFGAIYLRTGRFSSAFLAHAACNAAALVVMAFSAG